MAHFCFRKTSFLIHSGILRSQDLLPRTYVVIGSQGRHAAAGRELLVYRFLGLCRVLWGRILGAHGGTAWQPFLALGAHDPGDPKSITDDKNPHAAPKEKRCRRYNNQCRSYN